MLPPTPPAAVAGAILEALRAADLAALDERLAAAEAGTVPPGASALAAEEAELAAAAAGAIRRDLARFRRGLTAELGSLEIPVALLRHLGARRSLP
jgi:hypothetical protein